MGRKRGKREQRVKNHNQNQELCIKISSGIVFVYITM